MSSSLGTPCLSVPYLYKTDRFASTPRETIIDALRANYKLQFYEYPDMYLRGSWSGSISALQTVIPDGVQVVMEYSFRICLASILLIFVSIRSPKAVMLNRKVFS